MAIRFERNLENPERRIEREERVSQINLKSSFGDGDPYEDEFDKKLDENERYLKNSERKIENHIKPSKITEFKQSIKVEQQRTETPLSLAYQELDRARQSKNRDDVIKCEDKILDIERREEEREYNLRIAELREMQKGLRESGDTEGLKRFSKMRKTFIREMKYDELNYKIRKLQNSQRLQPSKEKIEQIMKLKEELEELEREEISK